MLNQTTVTALQALLYMMLHKDDAPHAPGDPDADFTVCEIGYNGAGWFIEGLIAVDILTDRINSCGNCKGCASRKDPATIAPRQSSR